MNVPRRFSVGDEVIIARPANHVDRALTASRFMVVRPFRPDPRMLVARRLGWINDEWILGVDQLELAPLPRPITEYALRASGARNLGVSFGNVSVLIVPTDEEDQVAAQRLAERIAALAPDDK